MGLELRFLTTVPRVADPALSARSAIDVTRWADEFDLDGVLLFTGAGAVLDPWVGATAIVSASRRLVPMVAVNPLYTHPFAAARSLLSIAELYRRRVDLNLITGAAVSELAAVCDDLDHRDRYARLQEYAEVLMLLLDGGPVTWNGRFYRTSDLRLTPSLPADLRPRMYLAGRSDDAGRTAKSLGAIPMGMYPSTPEKVPHGLGAVNVGVVVRPTAAEAATVARLRFPDDPVGREMLRLSMGNTDSVWKQDLAVENENEDGSGSCFTLTPFRSFQADCPYLVGDYDAVASNLGMVIAKGVHTVLFDTPMTRADFEHMGVLVQRLRAWAGTQP
ncbi:LLM class flavin-dependent oxidoreductase [Nonomuraea sp. NPDC004354]